MSWASGRAGARRGQELNERAGQRRHEARAALQQGWGLTASWLRVYTDRWNTVVDVRCAERRYTLRLHSPDYHHAADIASELMWLKALGHDGIRVPTPVRTTQGALVHAVAGESRVATLLHWVEGRTPVGLSTATLQALGMLLARLHRHSAHWPRPRTFSRPTWSPARLSRNFFRPYDERGWERIPSRFHAPFQTALALAEQIDRAARARNPDAFGLIHADLHRGNLLHTKDGLVPIDFDDCGFGAFAYDLAIPVATVERARRDEVTNILLASYETAGGPVGRVQTHDLACYVAARAVGVALFVARYSFDDARMAPRVPELCDAAAQQLE